MSAGLIVAGQDFYETVGYPEATSILAAFATVLGVLPFVFAHYGPRIRERSRYALEVSWVILYQNDKHFRGLMHHCDNRSRRLPKQISSGNS